MLKLFSTFALRLGGHDAMHCHCHRHCMPSAQYKRNRVIRYWLLSGVMALAAAWLIHQLLVWACSLPGANRIG